MDNLTGILTTYSDTELAYLYKFQIINYLPQTQEKIKKYILHTRGLDESRIESLVSSNPSTTSKNDKLRESRNDAKDLFFDLLSGLD